MEDSDSEEDYTDLLDSAMQLIDPKLRSSMVIQNAQRQVHQKLQRNRVLFASPLGTS